MWTLLADSYIYSSLQLLQENFILIHEYTYKHNSDNNTCV